MTALLYIIEHKETVATKQCKHNADISMEVELLYTSAAL